METNLDGIKESAERILFERHEHKDAFHDEGTVLMTNSDGFQGDVDCRLLCLLQSTKITPQYHIFSSTKNFHCWLTC